MNACFLWHMEEVLDIYEKPYDATHPVLCFDERPCQLIDEVMTPMPTQPKQTKRQDYHYQRHGTCVVLLALEPLKGRRIVQVTQQKTKKDYAKFMKEIKRKYPKAEKITLVQDNLNTHNPSSFYETFPCQQAFELSQSFHMVYTPKKASWLNMAEIEFSALSKQCLDRRIANLDTLSNEVMAWTNQRNRSKITVQWQFTKRKARDKFQKFYGNICS